MTLLITVACNRAVDQLRRSRSIITAPIEWASGTVDPQPLAFEAIQSDQEHRTMRHCLDLLSDRDANTLRMAFLDGVNYTELAIAAGIPIGTMKGRIRRALMQLRVAMN